MKTLPVKKRSSYICFLVFVFVLLLCAFICSVLLGSVDIQASWIGKMMINQWTGKEIFTPVWGKAAESIILSIRIPRVLLAFIVGVGLTVSGILMQALTKNQLADPYILGISSGASSGAVLVIMTSALAFMPKYRTMFGAFVGAVLAMILAVRCATIRNRVTATQLVLAGIAVSALFSAVTNIIIYCSPESSKQKTAFFWMVGSLSGATWEQVIIVGGVVLLCVILVFFMHRALDVLTLGEETAVTLGVPIGLIKMGILVLCTLMTGSIVAVSGIIGFVGLVVPHISRLFVGTLHRRLIGTSVIIGGMFVILCDMISRVLVAPEELPIGVVTSFIGAPFFLWLLRFKLKKEGGN